ncbi:MAG: tetratricopeptide repeat protein [Bacteroidia bacterium]|jgi:tetratricopeptide (TPR) repeat protein
MYLKTNRVQLIFVILPLLLLIACNPQPDKVFTPVNPVDSMANNAAIKEASAAIEKDPSNPEMYYRRAISYYNLKYLGRALADIDDAMRLDAQNPLYPFQKGKICYAMNKTIDAEKAYTTAIALKPDFTEAQMKLAELYYIVKKHRESLNLLNSITAKNPDKQDAYFFKGMNYKETGDTGKAISNFQKALEYDKAYYDAAVQLGILYTAKGDKTAYDYLTSAIKMQRSNPEAYFMRGYYFQTQKDFQKALFDYRKVVDLDPSNALAYYNVGCINFDVKQYKEALRAFNISIQMQPSNAQAYYMRGLVQEIEGNKEDARLNYQYALQLEPEFQLAKERLQHLR